MSAGQYYSQGPSGPPPPHQQGQPYPPPGPHGQPGYYQGPPPGQPYLQGPPPQGQGYGSSPAPPYPPQNVAYGAPPGRPGYAQNYGQPSSSLYGQPFQQHGGPAPVLPSTGYIPGQQSRMDMSRAADEVRGAMKGFGTDEKALIRVLAPLGPLEIEGVKAAFHARHHRVLMQDIHSETSNHFREGLMAILRGPLDQDCHVLHDAIQGVGTKESALNDVLLARSNADLNAIKAHYHHQYKRTLESDVKGDLSMKTERLFEMVMAARRNEESTPVLPQQVDADVAEIYRATEGRVGADAVAVCSILASRSNGQVRAIAQAYQQRYMRSLEDNIKKEFSGHMEDALLFIVRAAEDPAKHDANMLENAMRGAGTNDEKLIRRVVTIHWNPQRLDQCKRAYQHFHRRPLADRIRGETRGDYERLMLACIGAQ